MENLFLCILRMSLSACVVIASVLLVRLLLMMHVFHPLSWRAFGEPDAKRHVKNALQWKRPKRWAMISTALLCAAVTASAPGARA